MGSFYSRQNVIASDDTPEASIKRFQTFLQIKSAHPDPDYISVIKYLKQAANEIGLEFNKLEFAAANPIAVLTWKGSQPDLPSILLNSHTDVVEAFADEWRYDPYKAEIADNGNIYARGTQDMKGVAIQYLEAIRSLKQEGKSFLRTIHLLYVPDEEVGGKKGMEPFVKSDEFKALNIGMSLDEGHPSPNMDYNLYFAERSVRSIYVKIPGPTGHGSRFIKDTAASKFIKLVNSVFEYREQEMKRLEANPELGMGDVTTINLTELKGGSAFNIIPSEITCTIDVRVTPRVDLYEFEKLLETWIKEAGSDITFHYHQRAPKPCLTSVEPGFKWWDVLSDAAGKAGINLTTSISGGATDSRFLREVGITAYGLSLINDTPLLLHANDEFINKDVFLKGIEIYKTLIPALADTPKFEPDPKE